ncbi:hypothetical protein PsorP6_012152 [Peronosclerospora sorghi]|uniref:Uncharacterized protein n=1 Tax=Peronosclerospora sorghi TaxID=230839 RepID=A0ACC0WL11_9STRA|nr:hypothetical protein PsorP6_012152 [Peronosclerospora sorghi]
MKCGSASAPSQAMWLGSSQPLSHGLTLCPRLMSNGFPRVKPLDNAAIVPENIPLDLEMCKFHEFFLYNLSENNLKTILEYVNNVLRGVRKNLDSQAVIKLTRIQYLRCLLDLHL